MQAMASLSDSSSSSTITVADSSSLRSTSITDDSIVDSTSSDFSIHSFCSAIQHLFEEFRNEEMELIEQHGISFRRTDSPNSQVENICLNPRKRRSPNSNEEPRSKRRMDRVSARLESFHISTDSVPNFADRFSDSSSSSIEEDDQKITEGDTLVVLDDRIRQFIKRSNEPPIIVSNPLSMAVVPYIARVSFDDSEMVGRIREIDDDTDIGEECTSEDIGVVTFPDEVQSESLERLNHETGPDTVFPSSTMNFIEVDVKVEDDSAMEIDD